MTDRDDMLGSRAFVPEGGVYRAFAAETVLLNLETGTYHGVNPTGARMLELLGETDGDVRVSIERLAAETGFEAEDISGELADFCAELAERGLLRVEPLDDL